MLCLEWRAICPEGEFLHVASVTNYQNPGGQRHGHDFFECFLVEKGVGTHWLQAGDVPLCAKDLWLVSPAHEHGFRIGRQRSLSFVNIALEASLIRPVLLGCAGLGEQWATSTQPLKHRLNPTQRAAFLELVDEVAASHRERADATFFVSGLLRILRPLTENPQSETLPPWLHNALAQAVAPEHLQEGLPRLLALCARSPEHVSRSFRQFLGTTPTAWLTAQRIHYARRLLETSTLPVLEIMLECGMETASHFHRCFKAVTGLTPHRYRAQCAQVQPMRNLRETPQRADRHG